MNELGDIITIIIGIVSSQWTTTYNLGYVFRRCPLGANSDIRSNGCYVKTLKTQVVGGVPVDGRARNGGKAGGTGVHRGADQHNDRTGVVKTEGIIKQKMWTHPSIL
jgi:hypothetical protein